MAEFESGDEFMANYGIYRATVCDLVREAARCFPLVAAMFAKSYLSFVIERLGMHPIVAVQSEAYVEIDSFVLFLEGICTVVMSSIRSSDLGAGHMSPEVVALADSAQLVLAWQPVAPLLVLNKLRFLSGIPGVLNLSAPFTSSCFEYLFSLLSYECTDVKDTAVEDQVMQVIFFVSYNYSRTVYQYPRGA